MPPDELLCYENSYTSVYWNQRFGYLRVVYKGVFVGDNFYEGGQRQIQEAQVHQAQRALYDLRHFPVSTATNLGWITQEFIPQMRQAGIKHLATVPPTDFYGRMSAKYILAKSAEAGVEVQEFPDPEAAAAWLAQVAQPAQ
ncbi:MAG: hypothetical protein MUC97_00710 [Bernardetiaceae bacterium]|jgi:hypothetical protein|nr:hypothetical protein [Bernardetiaceae bacterium]